GAFLGSRWATWAFMKRMELLATTRRHDFERQPGELLAKGGWVAPTPKPAPQNPYSLFAYVDDLGLPITAPASSLGTSTCDCSNPCGNTPARGCVTKPNPSSVTTDSPKNAGS